MTDERRWTIEACPKCFARIDEEPRGCDHCENGGYLEHIEVVPVSSVAPIARLRQFVESERLYDDTGAPEDVAHTELLGRLAALLDDVECASNPNNERTNDA